MTGGLIRLTLQSETKIFEVRISGSGISRSVEFFFSEKISDKIKSCDQI